ncbi:DMT family transporter [Croceibacterium sp. TMG7-5b_MA50]|uniref:DMT family transporter n=1 Tax=Croceibacterium sp. TMG7-5b_MA50 TaxID=3121290 RepID=UPI00322177BA
MQGDTMQGGERAGLLFTLAGFSMLSVGDAIVKGMAGEWAAPAMVLVRYLAAMALLGTLLVRKEGAGALAVPRAPLQWVRGIGIALSALGMFFALWIMPLAEATTITFTQPMMTALLAMLLLGEPARRQTWIATAIAFAGVAIVLRPNLAEAGAAAFLPLVGAAGMSVVMVANRASVGHASVLRIQYWLCVTAFIFMLPLVAVLHATGLPPFQVGWPDWSVLARCVLIGGTASLGHWLIYLGVSRAGAGTVAPMTYGQLLVAVALGALFFGEVPDMTALAGAALIVGAGLYLWRATQGPLVMAEDNAVG